MKRILLLVALFITLSQLTHDLLKGNRDLPAKRASLDEEREGGKKQDQPDKFLLFHQGIRTRDGEEGPAYKSHYKWNELQQVRNSQFTRKRASARTQANGVIEWKERGPGNVPGRTRALFNVPGDANNNTWLAGAATGGIWRTSDGGNTWAEVSVGFPALPISSFAADANASVIYAGTGEFISSFYSAIGNGIFKSADKGLTWSQIPSTNNNPEFSIVTRLIVNPADKNTIVATTVPHNLTADNTSSIMRSTDGGTTWTKVLEVTGSLEQIVATPANFNVQYASQNGVGTWKSTNAGATWNLSNSGMDVEGRVEISVSPVNASKLFATAEGGLSGTGADLYYSSNAGNTWSLVDVTFNNAAVEFFEGQGFYDNTVMCDPFNEDIVYFGGVSLFRTTISTNSSNVDLYKLEESGTQSFLFLQSFADVSHDNQRLETGELSNNPTVELRFGPGKSQKAHRFLVPNGATSGVAPQDYSYADYNSTIPFEVWDIDNNRQLMVSYRDQSRNGQFDLLPTGTEPAREYFFVSNVTYNASTPNSSIATAGGHFSQMVYNIFPALATGATYDPSNLPDATLTIRHSVVAKLSATTVTAADGRGSFDNKNKSDQIDLDKGVHPDHHFMIPAIVSQTAKTYKILLGNDGGVFVSKVSTIPGITEGDWTFKGFGLNTSQFYGADKRPGVEQYVGGMQDNGTRFSPSGENADETSNYTYAIGGDGFEVIWNNSDGDKIIGSVYNAQLSRSLDGGFTWQSATTGLDAGTAEFAFVTKLANSKDFPDRIFTVGSQGVYVSNNFGGSWQLTPITSAFVSTTASPSFLDIEVSRANANVVWAGGGMFNTGTVRKLHVSTDGGKAFEAVNNFTTVPMGSITKLASHPVDDNTAYAIFSFADAPKILRTTNLGQSWDDITGFGTGDVSSNGFPDVAVYCLYVRPDNPNILWAGTEIGIVESLDNGATWALLPGLPSVSVWDMKGQDDEVVIATHGRGIWTAKIDAPQVAVPPVEIVMSGTSPTKNLVLRINAPQAFDSLIVQISGGVPDKKLLNINSGMQDIEFANIAQGEKKIVMIGYINGRPVQSRLHTMQHIDLLPVSDTYSTYFNSLTDVAVSGMTLKNFTNTSPNHRKSLMTDHPYKINSTYQVFIKTPITVSTTLPVLYYSDVTVTEPGVDMVTVEATRNGLDWVPLKDSYSSADDQGWTTAFDSNADGTSTLLVKHEIDISEKFAAGEVVLFRLRMNSGPSVTAWGWALDYVSIQEQPLSAEMPYVSATSSVSVYPNPTADVFRVQYVLDAPSPVSMEVVDVFGRAIESLKLGMKNEGIHEESVSLGGKPSGTYILTIKTNKGKISNRVSIKR